ncbi:MAG: ribonuclease HI [Pseudobacteriovorax sp.]|nr:ribonuclease HI [Pseudobacteriovorax sp.]
MSDLILKEHILLFTDGASKGNPGPGGWGAILVFPEGQIKELGDGFRQVTNNQMELASVIAGLTEIQGIKGDVAVLTDSTYVIQGITQWIFGWLRNGWKTASGNPVSNKDYWQSLLNCVEDRKPLGKISWHYVRGHTGIPGNERADEIGSELALNHHVDLYAGPLSRYHVAIHDIPDDTSLPERKSPQKSKKKAYSYLSYVDGRLETHKTWGECEARVKGRSGAKFKKALSASDEESIKKSWGLS